MAPWCWTGQLLGHEPVIAAGRCVLLPSVGQRSGRWYLFPVWLPGLTRARRVDPIGFCSAPALARLALDQALGT